MKELLIKFKNLEIDKSQLKTKLGEDLYNVNCTKPVIINRHDLIKVIQAYIDKKISLDRLIEWVNIIWFTDLYEILEKEIDSIMSVLEILETLDEDGVSISLEDFSKMINTLFINDIYS